MNQHIGLRLLSLWRNVNAHMLCARWLNFEAKEVGGAEKPGYLCCAGGGDMCAAALPLKYSIQFSEK